MPGLNAKAVIGVCSFVSLASTTVPPRPMATPATTAPPTTMTATAPATAANQRGCVDVDVDGGAHAFVMPVADPVGALLAAIFLSGSIAVGAAGPDAESGGK